MGTLFRSCELAFSTFIHLFLHVQLSFPTFQILRVGGRIIISVWSMEQRHRRFESQVVILDMLSVMKAKLINHDDSLINQKQEAKSQAGLPAGSRWGPTASQFEFGARIWIIVNQPEINIQNVVIPWHRPSPHYHF